MAKVCYVHKILDADKLYNVSQRVRQKAALVAHHHHSFYEQLHIVLAPGIFPAYKMTIRYIKNIDTLRFRLMKDDLWLQFIIYGLAAVFLFFFI